MSSENSETRKKILQASWELLASENPKGARMSDIAKRAGVSRQAVYLHFPSRAELLIATTRYLDEVNNVDARLAASRSAVRGEDRLHLFVEAWGNYIPEIYGASRALLAMQDTDEAARAAWSDRMEAVRHGCQAAVAALVADETLSPAYAAEDAVSVLWMLLSVQNWEKLTREVGWSQARYIDEMQKLAAKLLVRA